MTIRVLVDAIHADLLHSLRMLFEDRFGWEMYVPHGMEWYEQGLWNFERARLGDAVARQFLEPWHDDEDHGDHWCRVDRTHPTRMIQRVTIEQARQMDFDLVVATLVENERGLHEFAQSVGAHYGIQIGNQGAMNNWSFAEFGLSSVTLPFTPWKPHVFYRQEFDLDDFRYEWPPADADLIATRVQCITDTPDYARFRRMAQLVPQARFRHYGHCGVQDDLWGGNAQTSSDVASEMRRTRIAWHAKRWSDGYGHVIHDWFAVGRPVLGTSAYYRDKLAGPLFVEGVTSYDLDAHGDDELVRIIRRLLTDDEEHQRMSQAARARFDEIVNFDAEAEEIRRMLDAVLSDGVTA